MLIHLHYVCRIIIVKVDLDINIDLVCYLSSFIFLILFLINKIGHACAGTAGYCDVFGKCRAVDAEGPLTRLKNMLLNEENIRTLTQLTQVLFIFLRNNFKKTKRISF